jgi:hypothetical protein
MARKGWNGPGQHTAPGGPLRTTDRTVVELRLVVSASLIEKGGRSATSLLPCRRIAPRIPPQRGSTGDGPSPAPRRTYIHPRPLRSLLSCTPDSLAPLAAQCSVLPAGRYSIPRRDSSGAFTACPCICGVARLIASTVDHAPVRICCVSQGQGPLLFARSCVLCGYQTATMGRPKRGK